MTAQRIVHPILEVKNLEIRFGRKGNEVPVVRDVSFTVCREKVGIVGESGSGKTLTARSIIGLLPKGIHATADRMNFGGIELLRQTERSMLKIRGRRMAMVLQDPKYCLNPLMRIGDQIAEGLPPESHRSVRRQQVLDLLSAVRINDPDRVFHLYPHQLSGGMGQRVMIAAMLAPQPEMLIADEPTSALDVTVRQHVLCVLDDLVTSRGLALLFISHDLDLVRSFCDRVLVMYKGRIVESLPASRLTDAEHPYTRALLASRPSLTNPVSRLATFDRTVIS